MTCRAHRGTQTFICTELILKTNSLLILLLGVLLAEYLVITFWFTNHASRISALLFNMPTAFCRLSFICRNVRQLLCKYLVVYLLP